MLTRQALAVTTAVARALRVPVDATRIVAARRRRAPAAKTAGEVADHIVDVGREHQLTYLRRQASGAEIGAMIASGTLPLVLVHEGRGSGAVEALGVTVVLSAKDGRLEVVTIQPDGEERMESRLPLASLSQRLTTGSMEVLVPLAIDPGMSAPRSDENGAQLPLLSPVARLLRLLAHEKRLISYIYLYAALAGLFGLTLPLGVQAIIGLVSGGMIFQPVVLLIAFVILGTMANGGLQIMQLSVVETVQQRVFARFAFELAAHLPRLRLDSVSDLDLPELMNRFFEIKTIQKSLSKLLTDWIAAVLQVLFGLILLTFYHPYFSLFGILLVVVLVAIFYFSAPRGLTTSLGESTYKYKVAHWLEELARNLVSVKFSGRSELAMGRMDEVVTGYLKFRKAHFAVLIGQSWAFVIFKTAISGGLLILGSVLVVNRSITLGQFVASEIIIVTVLLSVEKLILGLADVYDLLTAVEKAGHVTDLATERTSGLVPAVPSDSRGLALGVRQLSFTYPGNEQPVVQRVDLTVAAGERVAITGVEGAGESSLLALIGGLYENYTGAISYDGVSLRDIDRLRARELVGYCGASVALFEGTIEENVAVGRSWVRTEAVLEAVAAVGLTEWLHEQPEGLQTQVRSAAHGLPSQVSRKVEIARALAGRPRLLLLDDVFDQLDPTTKREMLSALLRTDAPWTILTVSHDAQVLAACDRVIVLRDGQFVSVGSYEELRTTDSYFRELGRV